MKNKKVEKYHFEEIILILLILASDLSKYDEDDLEVFGEDIEGRIDILFTRDFLLSLNQDYGINDSVALELEKLKYFVINLYERNWIHKLIEPNQEINAIRQSASKILDVLKIRQKDIKKFSEEHLNIDW